MKSRKTNSIRSTTIACAVGFALAASTAVAQWGGRPPGSGGGGEPPTGHDETAVNNLAYPAVMINNPAGVISAFFGISTPVLGQTFSYGCDVADTSGETPYPNTSCLVGEQYLTAAECVAPGKPCDGHTVDRIYWQKVTVNAWSADASFADLEKSATHLDWGDNLESRSWTASSVIRVETTPFGLGTTSPSQRGLQMWHVSGQGQTEQWGVRATDSESQPYVYDATYAILHTTQARLNIAKTLNGPAECPTAAGQVTPPSPGNWAYSTTGGKWANSWVLLDAPYTVELNVGGKYVYGYNWMLRNNNVPANVGKAGWWRLTFYTRVGSTDSTSTSTGWWGRPPPPPVDDAPSAITFLDPGQIILGPPEAMTGSPGPLPSAAVSAAEAESGPLYKPVVVGAPNHLSYIDICIVDAPGGGGSSGGGSGGRWWGR